jgi:hypothetical protein
MGVSRRILMGELLSSTLVATLANSEADRRTTVTPDADQTANNDFWEHFYDSVNGSRGESSEQEARVPEGKRVQFFSGRLF